jgi:zinc protease
MEKIESFLNTWYVPENMAIILTGDLDFDYTIGVIDTYWGNFKAKSNLPVREKVVAREINSSSTTIYGPDSPFVIIGYRFDGAGSKDELYLTMLDMIMSNNQAGLLDLNLVQKQKVLEAEASYEVYKDYSWFTLYGVPLRGQSLGGLSRELYREIEKIKNGGLESWYPEAVLRCFELDKIQDYSSSSKIESFVDSFVANLSWSEYLERIEHLKKINFTDLVSFVRDRFLKNYTIIYKKEGEPRDLFLIKKPNLTPVYINRDVESDFCKSFVSIDIKRQTPIFGNIMDFSETELINHRKFYYSHNSENNLFDLLFYVDIGRLHSLIIHYGAEYRDFIGAANLSPRTFQEELFKKGLDLAISSSDVSTELTLGGFSQDLDFGLKLLEKYILKGLGDKKGFRKFLSRIRVLRENAKNSKRAILWGGLYNYLHYGNDNPFKYYLTIKAIKKLGKNSLIKAIGDVFTGSGEFFYYGPLSREEVQTRLEAFSDMLGYKSIEYKKKNFTLLKYANPRFLFSHYDMVQCEIVFTGAGVKFRKELLPVIHVFNEYFGGGMDSVVFQEIRERRGLAYSAYANYTIPRDNSEYFMFNFYVGTQGDKAVDAIRCALGLLQCFPRSVNYFNAIKSGIIKNIESEGVKDSDLYYILKDANKYGIETDPREYVYSLIKDVSLEDLEIFL